MERFLNNVLDNNIDGIKLVKPNSNSIIMQNKVWRDNLVFWNFNFGGVGRRAPASFNKQHTFNWYIHYLKILANRYVIKKFSPKRIVQCVISKVLRQNYQITQSIFENRTVNDLSSSMVYNETHTYSCTITSLNNECNINLNYCQISLN